MRKLLTPVQYEPSLEELNSVRPLQLADDAKIVIPYPVLCLNPVTKDRPPIGKLARCDRAGALLASQPVECTAYEYITEDFADGDSDKLIQFSQQVSFVQTLVTVVGFWGDGYWTDPTYTAEIKNIFGTTTFYLPFVGTDLYIHVTILVPIAPTTIGFYGFY